MTISKIAGHVGEGPIDERIVPHDLDANDIQLRLHLERYDFGIRCLEGRQRILDAACGVGYGTARIADHIPQLTEAIGVDIDPDAIAYAQEHYSEGSRVGFKIGDVTSYQDGKGFDGIVSFETIEHVERPAALVENLVGQMTEDGTLVASVPTSISTDVNRFHRHDFTEASFSRLFTRHGLRLVDSLQQVHRIPVLLGLGRILRARIHEDSEGSGSNRSQLGFMLAKYMEQPGLLLRRLAATAVDFGIVSKYTITAWRK